MARPRVFVSSTYYDLKHLRSSLENFVESLGFDPVLSEKGDIAYLPDVPLDESCYREVRNADIYVLIVGGSWAAAGPPTASIRPPASWSPVPAPTNRAAFDNMPDPEPTSSTASPGCSLLPRSASESSGHARRFTIPLGTADRHRGRPPSSENPTRTSDRRRPCRAVSATKTVHGSSR